MTAENDPQVSTEAQISEAEIAAHWREEEYHYPPPGFIAQANAAEPRIRERFREENFPECFKEYADLLAWDKYWHTTLDTSNPPFWKWFGGGRLNACYNCVDRHLARYRNKAALIWVPLACARLGIIHSEVFGGFSGAACGDRIADSGSSILVTMDGYYRNGDLLDHKAKAEEAIVAAQKEGAEVDKVLVWRRHAGAYSSQTPMVHGRDYFVDEVLSNYRGRVMEPVSMPAEAPLFLMYTSGTTARPKGCQHSTGGYLAYVAGTSKYYQDIHPEDTYWCFADIGWITGHSYIVYGPLALGTTSVMYEGVPTFPDAGRPWRIAERLGVNIFHTAPTTIRMLRKLGPDEPKKYNYHFKHMTTVGEPIEPDVWRWYYHVVGKDKAVIVDTWWQTENGGFLGSTLPALEPMKPGSCGPGVLGVYPVIYDEEGKVVPAGSSRAGNICIRNPWPGIFQGQGEQGLARLALLRGRWRHAGGGRVLPDPRTCRRRDQRGRTPAWHEGAGVGHHHGRGGRRGRRRAGDGRAARPSRGDLHRTEAGVCAKPADRRQGRGCNRDVDREDRTPQERLDRPRHAQDPVGQDHAPRDRWDLQLRRRRRHLDSGESGGGRDHPASRPDREGRARRAAARAVGARARGGQGFWTCGIAVTQPDWATDLMRNYY